MKLLATLLATTATSTIFLSRCPLLAQEIPGMRMIPDKAYALVSEKWMQEYASRDLETLRPFTPEKQLYIYESLQFRAHELWASSEQNLLVLAELKSRIGASEAVIQIIDSDGDGQADQWMHRVAGEEYSPNLGFMFDLNQDGELDYFIFNGGPASLQSSFSSMKQMFRKMFWFNYHWIDSNYDGHVDMIAINDPDSDKDGLPDRGMSAWIYDDNFDGVVNRTEYRGYTAWFPMFPEHGKAWTPEDKDPLTIPIQMENNKFTINRAEPFGQMEIDPQKFDIRVEEYLNEVKEAVSSINN